MNKRSVTIKGHRTSFSVEDEFWVELKKIARSRGTSMAELITQIDSDRAADENLSSAVRLFVLNNLLKKLNQ